MEETRNWLEMPAEIMGGMILQRLGAVEILTSVQKVCTTWRRICKDPAMWKAIDMNHWFDDWDTEDVEKLSKQGVHRSCRVITLKRFCTDDLFDRNMDVFEKLIKQAVHRSCGELNDISLGFFTNNELLYDISRCPSKLNRLCLTDCHNITGCGLINALKRLPHLETLELFCISIWADDIEAIGQNCPQLKSFTMKKLFMDDDGGAHAIANSMPILRHLKLADSTMDTDDGIQAILHGCPRLESLDLRGCSRLHIDGNLEKLCRERIKDFKYTIPDTETEEYEDSEVGFYIYDMNLDFARGIGFFKRDASTNADGVGVGVGVGVGDDDDDGVSGGSDISAADDYD